MLRSFGLTSLALLGFGLMACTSGGSNNNGDPNDGTPKDGVSSAPAAKFFMPTGEEVDNTSAPTLEVDKNGGIHSVYPAYAVGGAYYAYCPSDCAGDKAVKVVRFDTEGTVGNAMIALDADGKPQVLFSTYLRVYYGSCTGDCTTPEGWTVKPILEHGSEKEVTGEAFALDPQGRPRFVMHTYVSYLGIGQKPYQTELVSCDDDCTEASSWKANVISPTDNFESAQLRYDSEGHAHIGAAVRFKDDDGAEQLLGAYQYCASDCDKAESWMGLGFGTAFTDHLEAVEIKPQISLALTKAGQPRVLFLMKEEGKRRMIYFECNESCTSADTWSAVSISDSEELSSGFDLALDQNDHPRLAFAASYNIGVWHCDEDACANADAKWELTVVEKGSDMPPDTIFLEPNCTVGAWFLHDPSIALTPSGQPRIGYQARDISGGWSNPDPTKPACQAGTDMTWARMAILPSL